MAPASMGSSFAGLRGHISGAHGRCVMVDFEVDSGKLGMITVRRLLPRSMLGDVDGTAVLLGDVDGTAVHPTVPGRRGSSDGDDAPVHPGEDGDTSPLLAADAFHSACSLARLDETLSESEFVADEEQEQANEVENFEIECQCNNDLLGCMPSCTPAAQRAGAPVPKAYHRRMSV